MSNFGMQKCNFLEKSISGGFRRFSSRNGFRNVADSNLRPVLYADCIKDTLDRGRNSENLKNRDFHGLGHVESPFWSKNRRFRCAAHNVLKNYTWLVEMVFFRSNTILPAAVCRPSRRNRKSVGSEVVFERFLKIRMFNLNERPSEQALKYGESSGQ